MSTVTLPLTFRAVGQPTPGAPLEAVTRTVQSLQADEVLARVSYAAINAADGKAYNATVNFFQLPLPLVLGFDFSGVIVALGAEEADAGKAEALTVGSAVTGSAFGIGSAQPQPQIPPCLRPSFPSLLPASSHARY